MPQATTSAIGDGLRMRLGIARRGQPVQRSRKYGGVLERPYLGDLAPLHPQELVDDVLIPRPVDNADVDCHRGGDSGVPRPARNQHVLNVEASVREQPEAALPPAPE